MTKLLFQWNARTFLTDEWENFEYQNNNINSNIELLSN